MKFLALSVLLLVLFSLAPAVVRADEGEVEDDDEEEKEGKFLKRTISVETNANEGAIFRSDGDDESELKIEISNDGGGLRLRVKLEAEFNGTEWKSEHELNMYELVEYTNDDGVAGYDPKGSDSVVNTIDLNNLVYTFTCANFATESWRCDATTETGEFNVTFYVVGEVQARPGVPDLMPNGVEFDVHVRKSTANPLALIARFEGKVKMDDEDAEETEAEKDDDVNDKKERIKLGGAELAWLKTATLNGQDVPISMVRLDDKDVSFSLDTADTGDVVWDPFVGVLFNSASSFVPQVAMLFATIVGLLYL